ncbi:MIP/aquaporin family protein [Deinococcus geothermalis]|uniref:MIP/aquaporin family protein n=1 Tax=Deinococcus geothermalis TaxID=68909 RepID=UPI001E4D2515|nr:MIP/aquaporin family protein [Deinococcus geothermalis]
MQEKAQAASDESWLDFHPMRALVAEALGTFLLTFASVGALLLAQLGFLPELAAAALTPGLVVLAMIYALSDVSGAHINPAVTLAFALRGAFSWKLVLPYWAVQFAAAGAAGLLLGAFTHIPPATERVPVGGAFLLDAGATAVLLVVILATAHRNAQFKPVAGLAVGATVGLDHFLTNSVSAVAMNPAKTFGPALVAGRLTQAWPHLLGPVLGALVAVLVIWATRGPLNSDEREAAQGHDGQG